MPVVALWLFLTAQAFAGAAATLVVADASKAAPALHALVVSSVVLLLLLPFVRGAGAHARRTSRARFGLAFGTFQILLLLFHVATVVGYRAWQGPLTLSLTGAYLSSLPELLAIAGLDARLVFGGVAMGWAGACIAYAIAARRVLPSLAPWRDVVDARVRARYPRRGWRALLCAAMAVVTLAYLVTRPYWVVREPLHIALNDDWSQGHSAPLALFVNHSAGRVEPAPPSVASPSIRPRTLVLIVVDALRADQMGVYGAARDTTPFLSSLEAAGQLQRIDRAWSVCTVSFCGILGTLASKPFADLVQPPVTLPDVLAPLGYHTWYALSGDHRRFSILARLYGTHVRRYTDGAAFGRHAMNDDVRVVETIERDVSSGGAPLFLYVHLMSVHALGTRHDAYRRWLPDAPDWLARWRSPSAAQEAYRNRYHNGVLQADAMIGRVFEALATKGLLDDALVIITGDHGEWLGEGGQYAHGGGPYEPMTRVPLLIHDRRAAYPTHALASQIDIAPTFLAGIGADVPTVFRGVPLQRPGPHGPVALASRDVTGVVADVSGRTYKYLAHQDGREELFLLDGAAGESVDLSGDPAHAQALAQLRGARR